MGIFVVKKYIYSYTYQMQPNVYTCNIHVLVVFLLSDARKAFKRQKTLTNLNKSLSKTKISRLHLEDASTYWSQSFGKETTISWEKYDLVTAIIMWSFDFCTKMGLIGFNLILYEMSISNLKECK